MQTQVETLAGTQPKPKPKMAMYVVPVMFHRYVNVWASSATEARALAHLKEQDNERA